MGAADEPASDSEPYPNPVASKLYDVTASPTSAIAASISAANAAASAAAAASSAVVKLSTE